VTNPQETTVLDTDTDPARIVTDAFETVAARDAVASTESGGVDPATKRRLEELGYR